jgi:hypothetical protein
MSVPTWIAQPLACAAASKGVIASFITASPTLLGATRIV